MSLGRLVLTARPGGKCHGTVWQAIRPRRAGDCVDFLDQRSGRRELARDQMKTDPRGQDRGEHGQGAGITSILDLAVGEHLPCLLVPQVGGRPAREVEPADRLLPGEGFATKVAQRALQHRRPSRSALRHDQRQAVEEQVGGSSRLWRRRRGADRGRRVDHSAAAAQTTDKQGRGERVPVGLARQLEVERLEPLRRLEQQQRSVAATARGDDLGAQQIHLGALVVVERSRIRGRGEPDRRVEGARQEARVRGSKRALRAVRGILCQRHGALQERRGGGEPSASLGPPG